MNIPEFAEWFSFWMTIPTNPMIFRKGVPTKKPGHPIRQRGLDCSERSYPESQSQGHWVESRTPVRKWFWVPKKKQENKKCGFLQSMGKTFRRQPTTSRTAFQVCSSFSEFIFWKAERISWTPHLAHTFQCEKIGDARHNWNEAKEDRCNQTWQLPQAPGLQHWTGQRRHRPQHCGQHQTQMLSQGAIAHHLTSSYFSRIHLRRNVERGGISPRPKRLKTSLEKRRDKTLKITTNPQDLSLKNLG